MANYQQWNQAIASYFTSGIPRGTRVYLSVDDDILDRIGEEFGLYLTADTWGDDLQKAVTAQVIVGDSVDLQRLQWISSNGFPPGVAFLGLCVLAASQMAEDDKISARDYFSRLRKVFGLSGCSRPPGMESGAKAEEPLWKDWNRWLLRQGFEPTVQRGCGRPMIYINYPISQTLLRRADKERLIVFFKEKQWRKQWDPMTLLANVRREAPGSQHIKQLLEDRQRHEAVADVIHEVYQQWLDNPEISAQDACMGVSSRSRSIFAGLYRTEDLFFGNVDYALYPKQQRGRQEESISVQQGDKCEPLREERPGWYFPLEYPLNGNELDRGATYKITGNTRLDRLILPQQDFWLLIPDPDNSEAGVYASWGTPPLGTAFILLCKQELLPDLQRLRDERLIEWSGEPISPFENSNWVEIDQCMVISQAWDAVSINNLELKDALQPRVRLAISLSGGLRVPQQNAWLEEYPPQVTVFGFSSDAQLKITRISDNYPIHPPRSVTTNHRLSITFPGTGDYLIEATAGSASTEKFLRILPWTELAIALSKQQEKLDLGSGYRICGTIIQ
jgi:hypothetical protein